MEGCLNRSRIWLRLAALCLTSAVVLGLASTAGASVTIGQLPAEAPAPHCTMSGADYLQPSITGGNFYVARQAGTITSWSTNSSGAGAVYALKVFRRTSDPETFRVVAHSQPHTLSVGINTVPVSLPVSSGDMLGYHESGPPNSCTFPLRGDTVHNRSGDLSDGATGTFAPQNDVRLNLSAVLVPTNAFTLSGLRRDRKRGTAKITVTTSNPGVVTIAGKRIKKRAPKNVPVAGPVNFAIAPAGKARHRLARKGRIVLPVIVTFSPAGGDPAAQPINIKLKRRGTHKRGHR